MEGALTPGARASVWGRRPARAALYGALLCAACGRGPAPVATSPAPAPTPPAARGAGLELPWAEVLEAAPDPAVVADPELRSRLSATGLPWRVRDRRSGIELLLVPTGTFSRGAAPDDAEATDDERPAHAVVVVEPFYLGRYEVTQGEWQRVLGDNPSFFTGESGRASGELGPPVEQVALFRVHEFLAETELRLPTESQWEAACRAGDPRPRYGALDEIAWHRGNAHGMPHAVGGRAANALGFHDLLGNVWEWTASGFMAEEYARHRTPLDARAAVLGAAKAVLRGGSWYDPPKRARASARYSVERDFVGGHVGFRVMRVP
ncbi:MAG: formylglycine-generating enzyme family protein [Planctomycetota bacterium]